MNTFHDDRDIPEDALTDAVNVMCDIPGQVRQMGVDKIHTELSAIDSGQILNPGSGLFAFNSDYNRSGTVIETKMLAFQNANKISIYDGTVYPNELIFDDITSINTLPVYYYTDGSLRVCDASFANDNNTPRSYRYIGKTWFPDTDIAVTHDSNWDRGYSNKGLDSFIYPPTVGDGGGDASAVNQFTLQSEDDFASLSAIQPGEITIKVDDGSEDLSSEWITDSAVKFGMSFVYAGTNEGTDQESTVTIFPNTLTIAHQAKLTLQVQIRFGDPDCFDPRIKGCKFYWTGDSLGDFEDPLFLAYFHWGTSADDTAYLESHSGAREAVATIVDANQIKNNTALNIPSIPVLPYGLLNPGQKWNDETVGARYKTAVIVNRRAYIGNVKRIGFDTTTVSTDPQRAQYKQPELITIYDPNADRILKSPVDKFDIFPASQSLDIAINDGDKITAMDTFADRILQFKTNSLYILNVSGDYEYVEGEHLYKGVSHQSQVIRTEYGIAWANANGCFLFDDDGKITNLIDQKIGAYGVNSTNENPKHWKNYVGNSCMVGYLPAERQLIIFEDPAAATHTGDLMVYDFLTQSWTRGKDCVDPVRKSNIITNYNNKCIYMCSAASGSETIDTQVLTLAKTGTDASWILDGLGGNISISTSTQLSLNSVAITNSFIYNSDVSIFPDFRDFLINGIQNFLGPDVFRFEKPTNSQLKIIRNRVQIDGTYNTGTLSWSSTPSGTQTTLSVSPKSFTTGSNLQLTLQETQIAFNPGYNIASISFNLTADNNVKRNIWGVSKVLRFLYDQGSGTTYVDGYGVSGYNENGAQSKTPMMHILSSGGWDSNHDELYINLLDAGPPEDDFPDLSGLESSYTGLHWSTSGWFRIYYPSLTESDEVNLSEITINGISPDESADSLESQQLASSQSLTSTGITLPSMAIKVQRGTGGTAIEQIKIVLLNEQGLNITSDGSLVTSPGPGGIPFSTGDQITFSGLGHMALNAVFSEGGGLILSNKILETYHTDVSGSDVYFNYETLVFDIEDQPDAVKTLMEVGSYFDFVVPSGTTPELNNANTADISIGNYDAGDAFTKQIELIKPHRNYAAKQQYDTGITYSVQLDDQEDHFSSFNHLINAYNETEWDIAESLRLLMVADTAEISANSISNGSESVASVVVTSGKQLVVDSLLLTTNNGWTVGDCFKITGNTTIQGIYKINAITEDSSDTTIVISTTKDEGADGDYIKQSITNGTYTNTVFTPAFIVVESIAQIEENIATSIDITGEVLSSVTMREFNNSLKAIAESTRTANITIETPEYTFGAPETIKKFYSLSLTFRNSSNNITVKMEINNDGQWISLTSNDNLDTDDLVAVSTWRDDYGIRKFKTVKFRIESQETSQFQLTDLTIKYRSLGVRS